MSYTNLNLYRGDCYGVQLLLKEQNHPKEIELLEQSYKSSIEKIITEIDNMLHDLDGVEIYPEDIATFEAMIPDHLKDEKTYDSYLYLIPLEEAIQGKYFICKRAEKVQLQFFKRKFTEIQTKLLNK